jgi:hypothetical protein
MSTESDLSRMATSRPSLPEISVEAGRGAGNGRVVDVAQPEGRSLVVVGRLGARFLSAIATRIRTYASKRIQ